MEDMARVRLSLQVTPEDRQALANLHALIPNPAGEIKEAKVLRAVLRLGLDALARDLNRDLDKIPVPRIPVTAIHHSPPADDTSLTGKSAKELAAEADRLDRSEAQTELDSPAAREAAGKKPRRKR